MSTYREDVLLSRLEDQLKQNFNQTSQAVHDHLTKPRQRHARLDVAELSKHYTLVRMWTKNELVETMQRLSFLKILEDESLEKTYTGSLWPSVVTEGLDAKRHYYVVYMGQVDKQGACEDLSARKAVYKDLSILYGLRSPDRVEWTGDGKVCNFSLFKFTNKTSRQLQEQQLQRSLAKEF